MDNRYKGMTVNERLYISGLIDEFEEEIRNKNISKIILILEKVEITDKVLIDDILKQFSLSEEDTVL